jgi:hypothetical protein
MKRLTYAFYTSRLWAFLLRLTGRVRAGGFVGWGRWMTLKDAQGCVGPGWAGLVKEGFDLCLRRGACIQQIKEKFGELRFYSSIDDEIANLDIERRSSKVCEECGKPGRPRPGGWTKTLCNECDKPENRWRRRQDNWNFA